MCNDNGKWRFHFYYRIDNNLSPSLSFSFAAECLTVPCQPVSAVEEETQALKFKQNRKQQVLSLSICHKRMARRLRVEMILFSQFKQMKANSPILECRNVVAAGRR